MNAELMRKRPAEVLAMHSINIEVIRKRPAEVLARSLVGVERPIEREHRRLGTPADWPAEVWVPLLCSPGLLLATVLIVLVYRLT